MIDGGDISDSTNMTVTRSEGSHTYVIAVAAYMHA